MAVVDLAGFHTLITIPKPPPAQIVEDQAERARDRRQWMQPGPETSGARLLTTNSLALRSHSFCITR